MRSITGGMCAALLVLAGCASAPERPPTPEPGPTSGDEAAVAALYDRIGAATSQFQGGLELIRAGSPKDGRETMRAALADVEDAALRCAETVGCESQRFIGALVVLVRLQSVAAGWDDFGYEAAGEEAQDEVATAANLPQVERSVRLLRGKDLRELIELNEPVRAALEDWLTWMRPQLIEAWVNYQYLRSDMYPAYQQAGLPEALLFAILAKESAGRVHVYSRAGAAGPLQFMPATARRFGLGGNGFDERLDPAAVARANVRYIEEQLAAFNDNLELTLAAYNGGEGRMRRLARQHPGRGFWSERIFYALPSETRDYVPKVLAAAYLFLHPEQYGLRFPTVDNILGEIGLESSMSLAELAICLGQDERPEGWFRTLRNLNPRIKSEVRLPLGSKVRVPVALVDAYAQRCRDQDFLARIAALQDAAEPEGPTQVGYAVRRGDTLAAIARRTRCSSVKEIAALNGIRGPKYALKVGQRLRLPTCS
ncbi:MAG: transglycosylase SLT domain-containing protein [Rhodanobacteraceae bacterium]|nr:transglycosylase SLT domain-containing protein [Rhodanobacteraceae bacterium]